MTSVMTALESFHFLPAVVPTANSAFQRYDFDFHLYFQTVPKHRLHPLLATHFISH